MFPAPLPCRRRLTLRAAQFQYSSFDEAALFNPSHPASRRFNVGKRAGCADGVKTLLGFYIRPFRNLRKRRHIVADQFPKRDWYQARTVPRTVAIHALAACQAGSDFTYA